MDGRAWYNRSSMHGETTWILTIDALGREASADARQLLRKLGDSYIILSFSSARDRQAEALRLQKAGFPVTEERIYTSVMAAADAIRHEWPNRIHMDMIGSKAMENTLRTAGFLRMGTPDWLFIGQNRAAGFTEYSHALEMIMNGARPVALEGGMVRRVGDRIELGAGAIVAMLEAAGQRPALHFDRVNRAVLKQAARYGNLMNRPFTVVDCGRLWDLTDLNEAGVRTVLLAEHGVDENPLQAKVHPHWIVPSLSGLYRTLYET